MHVKNCGCLGGNYNKNRSIKKFPMKISPNLVRCSLFAAFAIRTFNIICLELLVSVTESGKSERTKRRRKYRVPLVFHKGLLDLHIKNIDKNNKESVIGCRMLMIRKM
jgi:hypothetical protein